MKRGRGGRPGLALLVIAVLLGVWTFHRRTPPDVHEAAPARVVRPATTASAASSLDEPVSAPDAPGAALFERLRHALVRGDARPREALLTFKDAASYEAFLARAAASGLTVVGQLDRFLTARVRYDRLASVQRDLLGNAQDYTSVGPNYILSPPEAPTKENRLAGTEVPFGNSTLNFLGVPADHSAWGQGTTIAILDSGVSPDRTFGQGRLTALDIGMGTAHGTDAEAGHGTAIAALAAGSLPDAAGVAPSANLLSIRVTDTNGISDIFTVAQGIVAAVDAGAKIINISLGGYGTNEALDLAIGYASDNAAVVVAAAGNDQAAQLTWPAADARVASVGAVDALGQQVLFSNSGPQLQMTAPGYGVQTAWIDGQRVIVNGTSASAPIVAGAIAAMMSQSPGYTAAQAWAVLQQTASDNGAPGQDPAYGNGVLNLAWAMNRNDPEYVDTAIASHYYDAANQQMEFVVQNRGGASVGGLELEVTAGGVPTNYAISTLAAGATTIIKVPVDAATLAAGTATTYTTRLINPVGVTDQVPANNRRTSILTPPAPPTP